MNYLGIDYGTKRIGIAYSIGKLAEPLTILKNSSEIFTELQNLCQQKNIDKIILGLSDRQMAEQTKQFAKRLQQALGLPIEFIDESYSSVQIEHLLKTSSKNSRRGQPIDDLSAAYFLQEYLDIHPQGKD